MIGAHRRRGMLICISLVVMLLAVSCAPAAPAAEVPSTATPVPEEPSTATPVPEEPTAVPEEPSTATPVPEPEVEGPALSAEDMPRVTVDELKELMDSGAEVVVLDNRPKGSYDLEHIEGAILFPWTMEVTEADVETLSRDQTIVTYCDCGPGEADSADIAAQLAALGFEDVRVLAHPAIEGWIEAGYPTE